jgi:hypothetical protein
MNKREQAKAQLLYYFQMLAIRSGAPLGQACLDEIAGIVDLIVEAALGEMAQKELVHDAK